MAEQNIMGEIGQNDEAIKACDQEMLDCERKANEAEQQARDFRKQRQDAKDRKTGLQTRNSELRSLAGAIASQQASKDAVVIKAECEQVLASLKEKEAALTKLIADASKSRSTDRDPE